MHDTLPIAGGDAGLRPARHDLRGLLDNYERALILTALATSGGNQRRAAAQLSVLPSTFSEKMKRLGLRPAGPRPVETGPEGAGDALAGSAAETP
jgi:DNA-binding NtrC family response regulator